MHEIGLNLLEMASEIALAAFQATVKEKSEVMGDGGARRGGRGSTGSCAKPGV
jgi:hypothetical protein